MKEDAAGSGLEPAGVLFIYMQMLTNESAYYFPTYILDCRNRLCILHL